MSVYVDTSAFLAIMDADDPNHVDASAAWERCVRQNLPLCTSNYVVVETISLLHKRFGVGSARRFQEDALTLVSVIWVQPDEHLRAVQAVLAGSRKGPSLVDCVSFEIIAAHAISSVLAYDRHFAERGYRS